MARKLSHSKPTSELPATLDGLPSSLVGVSGEYFVAAELSRRGCVASVTLRNTRGIDVLASNADASRSVGIQVKANRGTKKHWILHEKAEAYHAKNLFYVFVNLNGPNERPAYHVVPSRVVARYVKASHSAWLAALGKGGKHHRDSTMRVFSDDKNKFLGRWDLLGLDALQRTASSGAQE